MQNENETSRRLYLRLAVKLMLYVAAFGTVWVLLQATGEKEATQKKTPSVAFDTTEMQPGDMKFVVWANKPLLIMRRKSDWNSALLSLDNDLLRDPLSQSSVQPDLAVNAYRSAEPDWFVAVALGTGTGCPLKYIAPSSEDYMGVAWPGGFVDSCDASRYDLAGRVFREQSAKKNIVVPEWQLVDGNIVVGG